MPIISPCPFHPPTSPSPRPQATTHLPSGFFFLTDSSFWKFHINRIIQLMVFLLSSFTEQNLFRAHLRCSCISALFFFVAELYSIPWNRVLFILFIHVSLSEHLDRPTPWLYEWCCYEAIFTKLRMTVSLLFSVYPGVEGPVPMVTPCWTLSNCNSFPRSRHHWMFLSTMLRVLISPHPFQALLS